MKIKLSFASFSTFKKTLVIFNDTDTFSLIQISFLFFIFFDHFAVFCFIFWKEIIDFGEGERYRLATFAPYEA